MKYIYLLLITTFFLTLTSCSKKPEPYYDRANQAAEKAHDKLSKE